MPARMFSLKLFLVFIVVGKPCICYVFHSHGEWARLRALIHTRDYLHPVCLKSKYREPTCIVWLYYACNYMYMIPGNFRGVQFSRMVDLIFFAGLIFTDSSTHAHIMYCAIELFCGFNFHGLTIIREN